MGTHSIFEWPGKDVQFEEFRLGKESVAAGTSHALKTGSRYAGDRQQAALRGWRNVLGAGDFQIEHQPRARGDDRQTILAETVEQASGEDSGVWFIVPARLKTIRIDHAAGKSGGVDHKSASGLASGPTERVAIALIAGHNAVEDSL